MNHRQEFKRYATGHLGLSALQVDKYIDGVDNMTRTVIEERPSHFREIDVFSRLSMNRIIFIGTQIDDYLANVIVAKLLFLESTGSDQDISMYINSPGGNVYAGLGIYDTMQYVNPDIATVCVGLAASMAAVLLASGKKGKRVCLPHSRVMIHQPLGGAQGQVADMEINLKQVVGLRDDLYKILADHTGKRAKTIAKDSDRDYWMRAIEAKRYGIVDEVLFKHKNR